MQSKVIKLSISSDGGIQVYLKDSFIDSHLKGFILSIMRGKKGIQIKNWN